ncbi:MAG: hypothetical protein ACRDPS_01495 [Nocardioides sp.]|uniref:hypothetical protein n=1 Tax=Nocardioides sp. TaxID=35761 RepID=UPI003D6BA686
MGIRVEHSLDDLAADLRTIATTTKPRMVGIVRDNVAFGERTAQRLAKESSGPHGLNYFKRITSEMTGDLEGEYGPHDGNMIGGGWRHGENTDLPRSADIIGPKFAGDVHDEVDTIFWPGA